MQEDNILVLALGLPDEESPGPWATLHTTVSPTFLIKHGEVTKKGKSLAYLDLPEKMPEEGVRLPPIPHTTSY